MGADLSQGTQSLLPSVTLGSPITRSQFNRSHQGPFLGFTPCPSTPLPVGVTPLIHVSSCFHFLSLSCPALKIRTFLSSLTLTLHSAGKEEKESRLGVRRTSQQGSWRFRKEEERSLIPPGWCYQTEKRGGNRLSSWGLCMLAGACLCAPWEGRTTLLL